MKVNPTLILTFFLIYFGFIHVNNPIKISLETTESAETPGHDSLFVKIYDGKFMLDGSVFRFAGTNAYYLPNYEKIDPKVVENTLNTFKAADISVIRMWAFYDGYDCGYSATDPKENVIQTLPGVYNEQALINLDLVIAKGKQRGLRFILPFINYWDELGGICQYNTWAGAENPSVNMQFFLNNEQTQKWYLDYVSMLLNRVNTFTGVAYKDEPAILSWQIMNEGRNKGHDPKILRDWYREMAQFIKSIAPNQLVGTGEEGFDHDIPSAYSVNQYSNTYVLRANEGTSYILNTAIPEIDYGNAHWYPSEYGLGFSITDNLLRAQNAWISDHKSIANENGKPFLLGEYGFPGWGDDRVRTMYTSLWNIAEEIELDGSLIWQLTSDYTKCSEYGGNICWPGGREDTELFKLFIKHIINIQER
ncbi:MAG: cellulase family glycosylhydrolase [Balneolales bacterium]|nr:cellulase family glycosylhydrolase [Balneolales bacterium]